MRQCGRIICNPVRWRSAHPSWASSASWRKLYWQKPSNDFVSRQHSISQLSGKGWDRWTNQEGRRKWCVSKRTCGSWWRAKKVSVCCCTSAGRPPKMIFHQQQQQTCKISFSEQASIRSGNLGELGIRSCWQMASSIRSNQTVWLHSSFINEKILQMRIESGCKNWKPESRHAAI